jgi:hypothetical protein
VIIHGQKVPVERPRLRDGVKEAKLGSNYSGETTKCSGGCGIVSCAA